MKLSVTVNGVPRQVECDPRRTLLRVLREELGLTGTKYGCGEGECGACSVELDGQVVNACLTPAGRVHGGRISTIEAMPEDAIGRRLLDGLVAAGAVQCGFCTPGFVLSARELLDRVPAPDEAQIRHALSGNLCRCTGYASIVEGVKRAATGQAGAPRPRAVGGPAFEAEGYARPATLAEALERLAAAGDRPWTVLAGGTDLLVRHEHRLEALRFLDLGLLTGLRGLRETAEALHVGALTSLAELGRSPLLVRWAPALAAAARGVGGAQIQNAATLGGNLANGSPAADTVPPLFTLGARLVLRSVRGERAVPVEALATGPGRTALEPGELLVEVVLPRRERVGRRVAFFEKVGPRRAMTIAKASVALCGWLEGGRWREVAIALGAVAPTVVAAPRAARLLLSAPFDRALLEAAADLAAQECAPIDDLRSTAVHRRRLVRGLLLRNLWPFLPAGELAGPTPRPGAAP